MNYATARNNATTNTLDTHNLETQNDRNRKQFKSAQKFLQLKKKRFLASSKPLQTNGFI